MRQTSLALGTLLLLFAIVPAAAAPVVEGDVARVTVTSDRIVFEPTSSFDRIWLSVSGPEGRMLSNEIDCCTPTVVEPASIDGLSQATGRFTYELRARVDAVATVPSSESGRASGAVEGRRQHGHFRLDAGALVPPGPLETSPDEPDDQLFFDDVVIAGDLCVGLDCVNGEPFDLETLRLKENNLRIRFQDTSNSASFPTRDWQLVANESTNGGAEMFALEDLDSGRFPWTIEADAIANAIYVDDGGRVGFGTATPATGLHLSLSDTPQLRLEQTADGGFPTQAWDLGGNEASFFLRDVDTGSLTLRVQPGAPGDSLYVASSGDVGLGTAAPAADLHVVGDGAGQVLVEEASSTADRTLLVLRNDGAPALELDDTSSGTDTWQVSNGDGALLLDRVDTPSVELSIRDDGGVSFGSGPGLLMLLDAAGNLTVRGTVNELSSATRKRDVEPVDAVQLLDRVRSLPIATWSYEDEPGVRHVGPMAESFHEAFGLGADAQHVAARDVAGVAVAALQALDAEVRAREHELRALRSDNDALTERLERLELRLAELLEE